MSESELLSEGLPAGCTVELAEDQASLVDCLRLRIEVFVTEQGISAALELDEADRTCTHVLLRVDGEPCATLRLLWEPDAVRVGRLVVRKRFRGGGYGKLLMLAVERLDRVRACGVLRLDAQCQAVGFYERCGYRCYGPVFQEADIPHRRCEKRLS